MERPNENIPLYPVGEQDFKSLRDGGYVYVDKTMYIDRILRRKMKYLFLARPRRFGKSLFLSTLRYFFEGRKELFRGLWVDSPDNDWESFPVLYLDLNPERYGRADDLDFLLERLFRGWEEKYGITVKERSYSQRFRTIIEEAHKTTGRQVVILVDEYDKPLVSNLGRDEELEKFREKLASIYANFKSAAEHIKLVFLTGVSRFSKLSVFSDLNNIDDISFDDEFADICGLTEGELHSYFVPGIKELAKKSGISLPEASERLKESYDGYRFARIGSDIYNPWSVLNCMSKKHIGEYWNQTGMPTIIAKALRSIDADLKKILNTRCKFSKLSGLDLSGIDPLALLYQTGYLTIKSYDAVSDMVRLGIPNREVKEGFFDVLLPYYVSVRRGTPSSIVSDMINNIKDGEPEELMNNLDIFLSGIPYDMKLEDENNFQNAMYVLLTLIGIEARVEEHTSNGRIDLLIETSRYIYIIELKVGKQSAIALEQIEEKQYYLRYTRDSRGKFCIGANFDKSTRHLTKPEIRRL